MFKVALPCVLLLLVSPASAVLLGSVQGQVLIGRPLDVLVQSRLEPGQDLADLCLQTELVFGETVQAPGQLAVTVHSQSGDGALTLRLRSSKPVNEPIVNLHLQAGCQAVFRRSFTLLADWEPAAPVVAAAPVVLSAAAAAPVATQQAMPGVDAHAQLQSPLRLHPPRARPQQVGTLRSKAAARAPVSAASAAGSVATAPATPPALAATGARLQLDSVAPAAATALAAAPPSPVLPDAALATGAVAEPAPAAPPELETLRLENERLRLALESAIAQLPPKPEAASAPAAGVWPWLSLAAAAVLLFLAGLWYLLRSGRLLWVSTPSPTPAWLSTLALRSPREREQPDDTAFGEPDTRAGDIRAGDWPGAPGMAYLPVQAEQAAPPGKAASATVTALVESHQAAAPADSAASAPARSPAAATVTAAPAAARAAEQAGSTGSGAASAAAPATAPFWEGYDLAHGLEVADGRASMFAEVPIAALDPAQLLDAWQQADFFESIAQPQQAMQVLAAFIQEHPRASEAPYLRWLCLEAQAGGAAEAGLAARCYENHFQRMAPAQAAYAGTEGLEQDSAWLAKLQAHWPLLPARELLHQALASQPGESQPGALKIHSLNAFDDLILLLALLETLNQFSVEAPDLAALSLPPLATAPPVATAPSAQSAKRDPMWIDFDLSHLDAVNAQPAPPSAEAQLKSVASAQPPTAG